MGELAKWRRQNWVRIGTDGSIKGSVELPRTKRIQTVAYLCLKLEAFLNPKEQQRRVKRNAKAHRENNL